MENNIYTLPTPTATSWRESYDIKNLASYEAPNLKEINFILDNVKLTGGQSIDVSEYPFFGMWSNNSLNEKTHTITVSGFLRGENYIEKRNSLVHALRIETNDNEAGYLFLPLWGRFKVVVTGWSVDESINENGQCKIEINFNRAGERFNQNEYITSVQAEAAQLKNIAISKLPKTLNTTAFIKSLNKSVSNLSNIIGGIQGQVASINDMVRAVNTVTALISQGVKTPAILADAFSNIVESIVNGVIPIKQAVYETKDSVVSLGRSTLSYFNIDNNYNLSRNEKKVILQFVNTKDINLIESEYIKSDEIQAAEETQNFVKLMSLYAIALLLSESTESKEKLKNYISLYEKLDNSINKNDPNIYAVCDNLKLSLLNNLTIKNIESEKKIKLNKAQTLLVIENYLSSENIRELNLIEDSFNIKQEVIYV